MKQRRFIAWMLLVVSMMMLTASVLPHHHHRHILCLHLDETACECTCGDDHSHEATHHEACEGHCVTHFVSVSPHHAQEDVTPDYSSCQLLYTLADILSIPLPLDDTRANFSSIYQEKLHSTCWWHVIGLRAPPCFVLA